MSSENEHPAAAVTGSRSTRGFFWSILILGAVLRFLDLGRASYMIDEVNVVRDAAGSQSLAQIYRTEVDRFGFNHRLPLAYGLIHLAVRSTDLSSTGFPPEWAARAPFAIFGVLMLPLMFLLGREIAGREAGLVAMILTALSPFHIFYSREAYDYSLLMFFTVAVLWSVVRVVRQECAGMRAGWRDHALMAIAVSGLMYSHLSGLLYMAGLGVGVFAALATCGALRGMLRVRTVLAWVLTLLVPVLLFMPFLMKLLGGEWINQDESSVMNRSWLSVPPGVFGRMGWGQGWYAMGPFVGFVILGTMTLARDRGAQRATMIVLLLGGAVYGVVQAWAMRVGRFEVRYFACLFPHVVLLATLGLLAFSRSLSNRFSSLRPVHVLGACLAVICAWLAPSAWAVTQIGARGYNYKGLAEWIRSNIPKGGIYSYWNVYDGRGVPGVYATPDRYMAYPMAWSTPDDYARYRVKDRLESFFTRFPTAVFVETAPVDLVDPGRATCEPVAREALFRNRVWLSDPWCDFLIRMQTWPLGLAQWESTWIHKMHISFNRIEDLPEVAKARGKSVYHYFGDNWQYTKDQQMNDWLVTGMSASFFVGPVDGQPIPVDIKLIGAGLPGGCRLSVYGPSSARLLNDLEIPARMTEIELPRTMLAAGRNEFVVEILPPANGMEGAFALTDIRIATVR